MTLSERPHGWMDRANCGELPGFLNLPTARQREICGGCPVRDVCAEWDPPPNKHAAQGWPIYGGLGGIEQRSDPDLCRNGHDKTQVGTVGKDSYCRACRNESNARYRAKRKAAR